MRRHPRLAPLSREHHTALVLAKRIVDGAHDPALRPALHARLMGGFFDELRIHFEEEESWLLPAVRDTHPQPTAQLRDEHTSLRALIARLERGDLDALLPFGTLLTQHVRFEEREFFPLYEATLAPGMTTA